MRHVGPFITGFRCSTPFLPQLDQLQLEFDNFDIITPSETFRNKDVNDNDIKMSGYSNPFRKDRNRHRVARAFMSKKPFMLENVLNLKMIIFECI